MLGQDPEESRRKRKQVGKIGRGFCSWTASSSCCGELLAPGACAISGMMDIGWEPGVDRTWTEDLPFFSRFPSPPRSKAFLSDVLHLFCTKDIWKILIVSKYMNRFIKYFLSTCMLQSFTSCRGYLVLEIELSGIVGVHLNKSTR